VIGCGGVGLSASRCCARKGVKNIVACDIDDAKLGGARSSARSCVDTRAPTRAQQLAGHRRRDRLRRQSRHRRARHRGAAQGRPLCAGRPARRRAVHPLPPIAQRAIGIVGSYVGNLQELKAVWRWRRKVSSSPCGRDAPRQEVNGALQDLNAGRVVGRVVLDFERLAA
jgi:D-arabinose 1-dehydrogenase-like Zn-dependent alcohol dehydrogenase